ncbi:MAG: hypothetical protein ACM3SY_05620 [Candidatus Omnitrophota bacterium]
MLFRKIKEIVSEFTIDYQDIIREIESATLEEKIKFLTDILPNEWLIQYKAFTHRPTDVVIFNYGQFDYIFDTYTYPKDWSPTISNPEIARRVVAAFGRSAPPIENREVSRIKGWCGPTEKVFGKDSDKGHFIAHSIGGLLDVNLFPQRRDVNRGWSQKGKIFRAMEVYCALNPGTFCFNHPIYKDHTDRPSFIEFGVLQKEGNLWVEIFEN